MLIRKLRECPEISSGDQTRLRELLHPDGAYGFAGRYSLAHAVVRPNAQSVRHRLQTDEVYYILSGHGQMHIDDETADVEPGDAIEIQPECVQWIRNTGDTDLVFLCIVDPAWCAEDEDILK